MNTGATVHFNHVAVDDSGMAVVLGGTTRTFSTFDAALEASRNPIHINHPVDQVVITGPAGHHIISEWVSTSWDHQPEGF